MPTGLTKLRYGIVRELQGYPPAAVQRRLITQAGCDLLLEEQHLTRAALRAQRAMLGGLKAGDTLLVCSLSALQLSTGDLVLLFRQYDQGRVAVNLVSEDGVTPVQLGGQVRSLIGMLADNEAFWPTRQRAPQRSRPRGKPLSRFQIDYATDLLRRGASLRTVSQLFQLPPNELLRLIEPSEQ